MKSKSQLEMLGLEFLKGTPCSTSGNQSTQPVPFAIFSLFSKPANENLLLEVMQTNQWMPLA